MSYIGNQPTVGQYRKLDDISGSFNGSLTAFTMQVGSTNVNAGSAFQLLVSLGGVIQNPGTDFTVSGSTITFTTAPTSGLDFFAILMGQPLNTGTPSDGTVTSAKLATDISAGAGGGTDHVFFLNDKTVTTDYSIPSTKNAGTFGPCTVNSGVTVTIPSGSTWTIV